MTDMTDHDETKHPRGHHANKGSFSEKTNSAPEASLPAPELPPRPSGTIAGIGIKNVKAHSAGMEGGGFTATIYIDGKRSILVSNDGNGGSHRYRDPKTQVDATRSDAYKTLERRGRKVLDVKDDEPYWDTDHIVSVVMTVADFDKHADKNGWSRQSVAEASLRDVDYFSDSDRDAILNADKFQAPEYL